MDEKPEKYPPTYDEARGVGIASGQPPSDVKYGPPRPPPAFYSGEMVLKRRRIGGNRVAGIATQRPDVERLPNGALPGIRDKSARRLIRGALKRKFSSVERARILPQGMSAQARDVVKDEGNTPNGNARRAKRLLALELAIHQPVHAPTKKELRAARTERRRLKRAGEAPDAITAVIEQMAEKKKP